VWHLLDDPFAFWVEPRLTPSGIWILDEMLPVPDQSADIELVVEDSRAALPIAIERRRSPAPAGGTRHALLVQGLGDRSWGAALCELLEDAADDCGFGLVDAAFAAHGFARSVDLPHHLIAEAQTAA